jgi:hypothetical protein
MIFRAIFWIGLVALLAPHEPDLGLGRPGAGTSLPSVISSRTADGLSRLGGICDEHAAACAGGLGLLDTFQDQALRGLARIKAQINANSGARAVIHTS